MRIGLVTIGYNRPRSMQKLWASLCRANYEGDKVDLIISIDKGPVQDSVIKVAHEFEWTFGEKVIRIFQEKQGLKSHVIQCGNFTEQYDAIIVLEDDITVSPAFYLFAKQALLFYSDNDNIAGISLYKHALNPGCHRIFEPANNGFDSFLMQYAQSWGQCWSKKMWFQFKQWYDHQVQKPFSGSQIPEYVAGWGTNSWLKYFIKYVVENNKFFVYPQVSLSTNNAEIGQHFQLESNDFQVPLLEAKEFSFRFPSFSQSIKYDAFFERIFENEDFLHKIQGKKTLDLYGLKKEYFNADILVSTSRLPFQVIKTLKLKFRPHEMNCFFENEGKGIFVYNLHQKSKRPPENRFARICFDFKTPSWRETLFYTYSSILLSVKEKFGKKNKI